MTDFIENNKALVGIVVVTCVLGIITIVMGGGSSNQVGGSATVDNTKRVSSSVDKLDNGAIKFGNVGGDIGQLDMSKHSTTTPAP